MSICFVIILHYCITLSRCRHSYYYKNSKRNTFLSYKINSIALFYQNHVSKIVPPIQSPFSSSPVILHLRRKDPTRRETREKGGPSRLIRSSLSQIRMCVRDCSSSRCGGYFLETNVTQGIRWVRKCKGRSRFYFLLFPLRDSQYSFANTTKRRHIVSWVTAAACLSRCSYSMADETYNVSRRVLLWPRVRRGTRNRKHNGKFRERLLAFLSVSPAHLSSFIIQAGSTWYVVYLI